MLLDIRKVTRGWIAGGLLSLLAISFAFWGINDVLRPHAGPADAVASGKGVKIGVDEFRKAFDDALEQARQQQKANISREEAVQGGLAQQVLRDLTGTRAVDEIARKAGFVASNSMVAATIRNQEAFHSQITGAFDRDQYHAVLERNSISEQQFEDDMRTGIARRQLATTLLAGLHTPQSIARILYVLETERRVISVAAITPQRVGAPPEPTEADLKAYYDSHKANFQTPELRTVTIVKARPDAFASKVDIPEEKVKALYEFRKPNLAGGEKRSFVEISTPSQEAATEAARRLAAGEDPDKIAASLKAQAVVFSQVTKQNVPDAAVAEAVFALQKGQSTGAINGKLAWSAARVTDVSAVGTAPSFESEHDALKAELAKAEAHNALEDAVDKFDQERSTGKSLEDAAKDAGFDVTKAVGVNAQGAADETGPVAAFQSAPQLLKAAFMAAQGDATDLAPTQDGGYGLVRVDAIMPAGVRSYDQVKPILAPLWKSAKLSEGMRALADAVQKAVAGGQSFAAAVKAQNLQMAVTSLTVDRSAARSSPMPLMIQAAFGANEKDVVMAPDARGQVLLVGQVEHILREEPSRNPQLFLQARVAVDKMVSNDVLLSLQNAAFAAADIKTNQKLIDQTLGVNQDDSDSPPAQ